MKKIKRIVCLAIVVLTLAISGVALAYDPAPYNSWSQFRQISYGSSGGDVYGCQQFLTMRGYDPQGIDGAFGSNTRTAVRSFQYDYGLTVDGIVGSNTWGTMKNQVAEYNNEGNIVTSYVAYPVVYPWSANYPQDRFHHNNTGDRGSWDVYYGSTPTSWTITRMWTP